MALVALTITASATLAIPSGFRLIIDRGFAAGADPVEIGRWFRYLFLIVVVLALGTACGSTSSRGSASGWSPTSAWRCSATCCASRRDSSRRTAPSEISSRMTADTAQIEQVVGTTISVALRNALMAIGGIGYLLYLAPALTGMLVLVVPLVLLPIVLVRPRACARSRATARTAWPGSARWSPKCSGR